ncbi:hypothetical protein DMN91_009034 [Ooceraea biroi]|uniref:riboflavin kinase n=1 Tax=Ooceraea biroi TaxID=2015173 RepID=A0A3L8DDY4_OOCBI|nr:hypothetical protein DMN91_009034 [Ooceraea biroi]
MGNKALPYFASGPVIRGFGRGSKELGIPTANLPEPVINALPNDLDTGIYYGWASLHGQEVHLLHEFQNDFYGEELKVIITGYIRQEKDFSSEEELVKAIKNDIAIADERLEEPTVNKLKDDDFLFK